MKIRQRDYLIWNIGRLYLEISELEYEQFNMAPNSEEWLEKQRRIEKLNVDLDKWMLEESLQEDEGEEHED